VPPSDKDYSVPINIGACAVLLFGASILVVALKNVALLSAWGVIIAFQIFIAIGVLLLALIAVIIVCYVATLLFERVAKLEQKFDSELQALKRRTPSLLVTFGLLYEAYLVIVDKGFSGSEISPVVIIAASMVLIALHWFANEFCLDERPKIRAAGFGIWFSIIIAPPVALWLYSRNQGTELTKALANALAHYTLGPQVMLGFVVFLLFVSPFAFEWARPKKATAS